MFDRAPAQGKEPRGSSGGRRPSLGALVVAGVIAVSLSATALAASSALTLGSASNSMLSEQVVVNAQGRTLYSLSPETARHLLCKSGECLKHWPPVTVGSSKVKLKAGGGVQGHLGMLRRSNGMLQVTLRGLPLYRYSGDHAKGAANGDGIESFGGTWHAVTATGGAAKPTTPSTPSMPGTPSTPSTPPANPYPSY
jgi:predicted lipoprotein with Yx(FWY)xxD motif